MEGCESKIRQKILAKNPGLGQGGSWIESSTPSRVGWRIARAFRQAEVIVNAVFLRVASGESLSR